jgi:hypothetical protein
VEIPRKFITAKLSIRKPGSSSVLIICDLFNSHALFIYQSVVICWLPISYHQIESRVYTDAVLYSSIRRNWKHSSHPSLRRSFNQTTHITGIKPRPQWWKAYVKATYSQHYPGYQYLSLHLVNFWKQSSFHSLVKEMCFEKFSRHVSVCSPPCCLCQTGRTYSTGKPK